MYKITALLGLAVAVVALLSCGTSNSSNTEQGYGALDTPIAAYKRLFMAVKNKNTEAIKAEVSQATQNLAKVLAARQKTSIDRVYENGFTGTTFSPMLPDLRDQRIKGDMGALEVWNSRDSSWEDLPFVREPSGWKLAIGDVMSNKYASPGKGMAELEREAANAANPNRQLRDPGPSSNTDTNSNARENSNSAKKPGDQR